MKKGHHREEDVRTASNWITAQKDLVDATSVANGGAATTRPVTAKVAKKRKPAADLEDVPIRKGARSVGLRACTVGGCGCTPLRIAAGNGPEILNVHAA
jgi:hypothetical protein